MLSFKTTRHLGLSILLIIILAIGLFSFWSHKRITATLNYIVDVEERKLDKWVNVAELASDAKNNFYRIVVEKNKFIVPIIFTLDNLHYELEKLQNLAISLDENYKIKEISRAGRRFKSAVFAYREEIREGYTGSSAREMEKMAFKAADEIRNVAVMAAKDVQRLILEKNKNLLLQTKRINNLLTLGLLAGVFSVLIAAVLMSSALTKPVEILSQGMEAVAKGDLSYRLSVASNDEIGRLANSFNKMMGDLKASQEELKEAQNQLIQTEKMCAVGELASGVAHEVKNPLAVIIQGINYLENKFSSDDKDISEVLDMMKDSAKRGDGIVRTLVDFSRMTRLDLKQENINSILENCLALIQHRLKAEDIRVVKEMKNDLPKVSVDRGKIEQVFVNVFLNAIQATPKEGELFLRTYSTQFGELRNGVGRRNGDSFKLGEKAVVVEIEDTGSGISQENLKKVFDPFFTTKEPGKGTGLGLSVVKNIIDMHKGLIEIKSKEGKGTKVIITLKISSQQ